MFFNTSYWFCSLLLYLIIINKSTHTSTRYTMISNIFNMVSSETILVTNSLLSHDFFPRGNAPDSITLTFVGKQYSTFLLSSSHRALGAYFALWQPPCAPSTFALWQPSHPWASFGLLQSSHPPAAFALQQPPRPLNIFAISQPPCSLSVFCSWKDVLSSDL